jgi:hypothetical protein
VTVGSRYGVVTEISSDDGLVWSDLYASAETILSVDTDIGYDAYHHPLQDG